MLCVGARTHPPPRKGKRVKTCFTCYGCRIRHTCLQKSVTPFGRCNTGKGHLRGFGVRILIACEYSGVVRDEFRKRGHDAWSCDILPTERPGPHITGNVLDYLDYDWDMMIAHPPCTYLSIAGMWRCKPGQIGSWERCELRERAVDFVMTLMNTPIKRVVIENPVGYLSTVWRKPSQIIYMNDFGHPEARKPTCLWLKNVKRLRATDHSPHRKGMHGCSEWYTKTRSQKQRSKTFIGVAQAMATQWG